MSPAAAAPRQTRRPSDANLISEANGFGGAAWWHPAHVRSALSNDVPPLHGECAVMEHALLQDSTAETAGLHGYGLAHGVASGSIYVASIWVWLPAEFAGSLVGAVLSGFASLHISNARLPVREKWQRIWVSARVPPDVTGANPILFVIGPAGTRLYSTCWKLEPGVQPTDDDDPAPPPFAAALPAPTAAPSPAPARHTRAPDPADVVLLGRFESLGDNCEFGLVQRAVGIEPLGFFRFNFASMQALLRVLDRSFDDIDDPEHVEILGEPNKELIVHVRRYGFRHHTDLAYGQVDIEKLRAQQIKALRFLARKLLDDLKAAEKIFVRKGRDSESIEQVQRLFRALRRHGPATLLWVVPQGEAHSLGSVEVVEPGLLKGYIDRFAPYDDAYDFSLVWIDICRNAYRLWRDASPPGTVLAGSQALVPGNLIRNPDRFGGNRWWQSPRASARPTNTVAPPYPGCVVLEQRLLEATSEQTGDICGYDVVHGLVPGSAYVASLSVWLPADFKGQIVGAAIQGCAPLQAVNASTTLRGTWQRVWVSARIPPGVVGASPRLRVIGPAGTRLYPSAWKLELGLQPTLFEPPPPPPLLPRPLAAPREPGQSGGILARVLSPRCQLAPPELVNADLIPAADRERLDPIWFTREFEPREAVISCVFGATVAGEGLAFTDALELVPASRTWHSPEQIERARSAIVEAKDNNAVPEHFGTYVLCVKNGADNYGHWLMEMFPKAAVALKHLADPGLRFIVPAAQGPLRAVIADCMRSLGVGAERLLEADGSPMRIDRLVLVSGLTVHSGYISPLVIEAVRKLGEGIPPALHQRLYVSRRSAGLRDFADAAAVEAMARASGYEVFDPGTADLREQIATFAGAGRIVGIMGAAMTNIVFAGADAEIVVLAPARMRDAFFWLVAALRGQRYTEIRCLPAGEDEGGSSWFHQPLEFPAALRGTIFPPLTAPEAMGPRNRAGAAPAVPSPKPGRVYRCVALPELCELGNAQRLAYLPGSDLELPALEFGSVELSHPCITEEPELGAARVELRHSPVDAYVLRDAVVHGKYGIVTCGDAVIAESTVHLPLHRIPDSEWLDDTRLRLPERSLTTVVPDAYHLLTCNLDNYFHWLLEGLSRFDATAFRGLGALGSVGRNCRLLIPQPDMPWKRQSLDLLVPADIQRVAVADGATVQAARLLYVPQFAGGGWQPHRALLPVFDRLRFAAYAALGAQPAEPSRRLFVSRADSRNRKLTNAAELEAVAAAAGFTRIVLSEIGVAEQVRLFAEATHIVAPHGAGMTNLLFCRPGAAVCELHMDCYVNWAFRGLAALRGLRYGCLIGHHIPPHREQVHDNRWRLDPGKLSAVLADPRFRGVG